MKRIIILFFLISTNVFAQNIAKIDSGSINGADYRIVFPKDWKGKLLMYAHGYEFVGTQPRQSKDPQWLSRMSPFLDRGFAVAASDYQYQGMAMPQGVDDTEALRQYFVKKYGKPDSTFIAGHSMGGGITIATLEYFGKNYVAGMPMCPLAGRIYLQTRKELDLIAIFNGVFPGIMPSLKEILDPNQKALNVDFGKAFGKAMTMQNEIVKKDSALAASLARRFDLKLSDLAFSLVFGENVLRDVVIKAKGNPYDNTNTIYGGFPNALEINKKAERVSATISQEIFKKYDRTGEIDKPALVLHTIYDQLIPAEMAIVRYENLIQEKGDQKWYTVKYTNGQGHCTFTAEQTGRAFDELRNWAKTGEKAKPGFME
ncbi:MAG: alpha/beta hydrolase [Spirosomataceae bacterium]